MDKYLQAIRALQMENEKLREQLTAQSHVLGAVVGWCRGHVQSYLRKELRDDETAEHVRKRLSVRDRRLFDSTAHYLASSGKPLDGWLGPEKRGVNKKYRPAWRVDPTEGTHTVGEKSGEQ